jgi:hypothetical protein
MAVEANKGIILASTRMIAPAVGEGGMAVRFVAEHLARTARPRGVHLIEPSRRLVRGDTRRLSSCRSSAC